MHAIPGFRSLWAVSDFFHKKVSPADGKCVYSLLEQSDRASSNSILSFRQGTGYGSPYAILHSSGCATGTSRAIGTASGTSGVYARGAVGGDRDHWRFGGDLLPAIQAAREAGRRNQCRNNLKQMALGANNHLLVHKFLPVGGWGWGWTGDPNYGYDTRQPGGWMSNILPFIEEQAVHDLRQGHVPDTDPARHTALKQALATVIPLYFPDTTRRRDDSG